MGSVGKTYLRVHPLNLGDTIRYDFRVNVSISEPKIFLREIDSYDEVICSHELSEDDEVELERLENSENFYNLTIAGFTSTVVFERIEKYVLLEQFRNNIGSTNKDSYFFNPDQLENLLRFNPASGSSRYDPNHSYTIEYKDGNKWLHFRYLFDDYYEKTDCYPSTNDCFIFKRVNNNGIYSFEFPGINKVNVRFLKSEWAIEL